MSARKKPWTRSAFSQLNLTTSSSTVAVPLKRTRSANAITATSGHRNQETVNSTLATDAVVDLSPNGEDEDIDNGNNIEPLISDNWIESFAPSKSDDLAVHPKKIAEVRNWLLHCEASRKNYPAQICLLTGPAGSGKTAAVRVLAEELGYAVHEWINPIDCEEINALGDQPNGNSYAGSQLEAFKSFLLRASRYKSLLATHNKRLLLVEDFPNMLLKDATSIFEELLNEYTNYGKSPLVFIVADSKSRVLNLSYALFTDQLKAKLRIEHIVFNAIATTIMQKSMKRFSSLMQQQQHKVLYKVPTQNVLESIVVSAQGDIRNALINLHFGSLKGAPNIATQKTYESLPASKGRKRKATSSLKSIGRDESITMMHALGRVFNPKYTEDKDKHLLHSPEDIAEAFSTEPRNFVNFIHANYLPHFHDIDQASHAVNDIGISDMLLQEYRDDSLALVSLTTAVRGCMVANVAPVSGWMPVRGPKRITVEPHVTAAEQNLMGVANAGISKSLYASEYSSFVKCIAASKGTKGSS